MFLDRTLSVGAEEGKGREGKGRGHAHPLVG